MNETYQRIREIIDRTPVIDVHTHIGGEGIRQARNLTDLVSYHWVNLELVRAGADVPDDPDGFLPAVLPYFPAIRNTANHWCLMQLLKGLYGFEERTLTADNWQALDEKVRRSANDPDRVRKIMDDANVTHVPVPFRDGVPFESDRFIPYEYGEYLFAPTTPSRLMELTELNDGRVPETLDDLTGLIRSRLRQLKAEENVRVLHLWIRDSWNYCHCHEEEAANLYHELLKNRCLSTPEDDRLVSYTADAVAETAGELGMTLQIFHGMEFYTRKEPHHIASYAHEGFLRSMPKFASAHPETMIDLFLATRITGHEAASIARTCRNIIVSGAWWHAFTPATLDSFYRDRLEMLPHTAWNAFFSDGYIVEWIYGKLQMVKKRLALTLAALVDEESLEMEDVPEIARNLLHDNAARIYRV